LGELKAPVLEIPGRRPHRGRRLWCNVPFGTAKGCCNGLLCSGGQGSMAWVHVCISVPVLSPPVNDSRRADPLSRVRVGVKVR